METILNELGLARYYDNLKEQNITLQSFTAILSAKGHSQQLRELVQQQCGLTSGQVLAICDRVAHRT